jgi:class 3 adenylate cyclase
MILEFKLSTMAEFSSNHHQHLMERLLGDDSTAQPEERVRIMCELAYELRNNAPVRAKSFLLEAQTLLEQTQVQTQQRIEDQAEKKRYTAQEGGEPADVVAVAALRSLESLRAELAYTRGVVFACNSEYDVAFEQLSNALQHFRALADVLGESRSLRWLGICYRSIGMLMTALEYFTQSLACAERSDNEEAAKPCRAYGLSNIGDCYSLTGDLPKAHEYQHRAFKLAFVTGDKQLQSQTLWSVARLHQRAGEFQSAYDCYSQSYTLRESLQDRLGMGTAQYGMASVLEKMGQQTNAFRMYLTLLREFTLSGGVRQTEAFITLEIGHLLTRSAKPHRALPYYNRARTIADEIAVPSLRASVHQALAMLHKQLGDFVQAVEHFEELHRISQELVRRESVQTTQYFRQAFDFERAQQQAELYRVKHEELAKVNTQNEVLLRNILPEAIAERMKRGETTIAERFSDVTVLFADIVGFTELSAQKSPEEVVDILNRIFSAFDIFSEQYNLEKIKTIGDAYMIVGGVPQPSERHTVAAAQLALEMQATVRMMSVSMRVPLAIRIGFHVGPVVAGVIGQKKFAYDLWGDTVNTASRMESHGESGKIHVSEDVFTRLQSEFMFEKRGDIEIKGKGLMTTYFLMGKKSS